GFRGWRTRDAGAFSAGRGTQLCSVAGGRTELRWASGGSSPSFRLFRNWHCVTDDVDAHFARVPGAVDADSHFLTRPKSNRLRQRIPSDRFVEFHFGGN